jgi:hypothetical protein
MAFGVGGFSSWLRILQSGLILPTARTLYVIGACACLAAAALGIAVAFYFQAASLQFPRLQAVPPPYESRPTSIALDPIDRRLSPPGNLRFTVELTSIEQPLGAYSVLGRFEADTPNGLARFPDDFDVIGGRDAALFERVAHSWNPPRAGLSPAPALVEEINAALPTLSAQRSRAFELRVVARDASGRVSSPANVAFTLNYGPRPQALPQEAPERPLNDLEALAREIALALDPQRSPVYFDAYRRALSVPQRCGAAARGDFVVNFRRGFEHVRDRLTLTTENSFYLGVCDAWRQALAQEAAARAQAEAARLAALAHNTQERASAELKAMAARTIRNVAIGAVGAALALFLSIALLLAFLAIEGHSKAMRDAIEFIAQQSRAPNA